MGSHTANPQSLVSCYRRGRSGLMPPILQAIHVQKYFGAFRALNDVSLSVSRGEVVCIIGPSGSGKSTLLRCISQLESIDGGVITVDGEIAGFRLRGDTLSP